MSTPNAFRDRVKQLENEVQQLLNSSNGTGSESSMSTIMMISCAVPVVIFLGFYSFSPSIVMEEEDGKLVRSTKKLVLWTTLITAIIWGSIYGYNSYKGGASSLIGGN